MWMMLQQDRADDYVIATGESHSVEEYVDLVFNYFNLDWKKYVKIDPKYFRPTEVNYLQGNPEKAERALGWKNKTSFYDLVKIMCDSARQEALREIK
jgi:GDPmannose 4,6-dehydratase